MTHSPKSSVVRRDALFAMLALLVPIGARAEAPAARFVVVVHPGFPKKLERSFVVDAFLKKRTRWPNDEAIHVVDQRSSSTVRAWFSEDILKRSVAAVRSYWQQRIFSGRDVPPPELDSDDAVVKFVARRTGAMGYVSVGTKLDGVQVARVD